MFNLLGSLRRFFKSGMCQWRPDWLGAQLRHAARAHPQVPRRAQDPALLYYVSCAGLIGWVPNCDTLHALIREYRDVRKIPLNVEHRLMLGMAPDYDHLTVIQKVEVFEHALESTSGALTPRRWSGSARTALHMVS